MTSRAYWAARWLLFEERFGPLIREAERQARADEARLASDYQRSVARLKAAQEIPPDGDR